MAEPTQTHRPVLDQNASNHTRDSAQEVRLLSFWTSIKGQEVIDSFDGRNGSTNLSNWLAQIHPNLFGDKAGVNNLWGQKNRGVAAFAQVIEMMHGPDSETCRTLAEALNEYARLA